MEIVLMAHDIPFSASENCIMYLFASIMLHGLYVEDKGKLIVVPFLQLLQDVKTRWESVYGMISWLHVV